MYCLVVALMGLTLNSYTHNTIVFIKYVLVDSSITIHYVASSRSSQAVFVFVWKQLCRCPKNNRVFDYRLWLWIWTGGWHLANAWCSQRSLKKIVVRNELFTIDFHPSVASDSSLFHPFIVLSSRRWLCSVDNVRSTLVVDCFLETQSPSCSSCKKDRL